MTPPDFYIVADGNAYGLDNQGNAFGAAINAYDGSVEWDNEYDLDVNYGLDETDASYVQEMIDLLHKISETTSDYQRV